MEAIRAFARSVVGRWTLYVAGRRLAELSRVAGPAGSRVASALQRALDGPADRAQKNWFDKIETLRTTLESDSTSLSITDYGAGSSHDDRSEEQMEEGVIVHKTVSDMCRASKPSFWASILFELIREYQPDSGLELGTCLGISAAYQTSAMELNGSGSFLTLEGADSLAAVSAANLKQLGLDHRVSVLTGRFSDTLASAIEQMEPIGYAFIDGHHDEHATVEYFEQLLPHLAEQSVLVFDDTSWTEGMKRAWQTITAHDSVGLAVDLGALGICVIDPAITNRAKVKISFRGL